MKITIKLAPEGDDTEGYLHSTTVVPHVAEKRLYELLENVTSYLLAEDAGIGGETGNAKAQAIPPGTAADGAGQKVPGGHKLTKCERCGEYNGEFYESFLRRIPVQCLCKGPVCADCGRHYHRPGTYCLSPRNETPLNVSVYSQMAHDLNDCPARRGIRERIRKEKEALKRLIDREIERTE